MAKAATIKVKLVSTADTGYFYVTKKNSRTMTEKLNRQEVRPGREEARRVQGSQDQVSFRAYRSKQKPPHRGGFFVSGAFEA